MGIESATSCSQARFRLACALMLGLGLMLPWLAVVPCAQAAPQDNASAFPVPRAEAEFRILLEVPRGFATSKTNSKEKVFLNSMPYAPLDVQVSGQATHEEISDLKNMYFGALCAMLGVDPYQLIAAFLCGPQCTEQRRTDLVGRLEALRQIVSEFRAAQNLDVVSHWSAEDALRINGITKFRTAGWEAVPSPVMGFIPGGRWIVHDNLAEALSEKGVDPNTVESIDRQLRDNGVVGIRRDDLGVELIHSGIVDNWSGLLFLDPGDSPPVKGSQHHAGGEYVVVEAVEKGVYFFETH